MAKDKNKGRRTDPLEELRKSLRAAESMSSSNWVNKNSTLERSQTAKAVGINRKVPDLQPTVSDSTSEYIVGAAIETGDFLDNKEVFEPPQEPPQEQPEDPNTNDVQEAVEEPPAQETPEPQPEQIEEFEQTEFTTFDLDQPEPQPEQPPEEQPEPIEIVEPSLEAEEPPEQGSNSPDLPLPSDIGTQSETQPDTEDQAAEAPHQEYQQEESPLEISPEITDETMTEFPVDTTPEPPRDEIFSQEINPEPESPPVNEEQSVQESINQQAEEADVQEGEEYFQYLVNTQYPDMSVGGTHLDEQIEDQIDDAAEQAVDETVRPEPNQELADLSKDLESVNSVDDISESVEQEIEPSDKLPLSKEEKEAKRQARIQEYERRQKEFAKQQMRYEAAEAGYDPNQLDFGDKDTGAKSSEYVDQSGDRNRDTQGNSHESAANIIDSFVESTVSILEDLAQRVAAHESRLKNAERLLDRLDQ